MNYIDLIFLAILLLYAWRGYKQGFFILAAQLIAFFISLIVAFKYFVVIGAYFVPKVSLSPAFIYIISFVMLFFVIELLIELLLKRLIRLLPLSVRMSEINKVTGIVPAIFDGFIFLSLIVVIILLLPNASSIQAAASSSVIGTFITNKLPSLDASAENLFGINVEQSIGYFALHPESQVEEEGSIAISYHPSKLTTDTDAEAKMLVLVNQERAKVGAKPLIIDPALTRIAEAHSIDMWQRGYFSHVTPDGKDPFDRMAAANITYLTAGENIALSPNVEVAHTGLMNSPGHRANILNPAFGKIGIGIISGGIYGEMFTQDFTN